VYEGIDVDCATDESVELLKALQQVEPEQVADFVKQLAIAQTESAGSVSNTAAVGRLPKIVRV
jgi:hypothetical protein